MSGCGQYAAALDLVQVLLAATAVIQFCAQAFSLYAYQTAIYEIFTDQARHPACATTAASRSGSLIFTFIVLGAVSDRQ